MLYTRKGDKGTTKLFDCPQGTRMSKSAVTFEALGTLDELNSSLGYAKVLAARTGASVLMDGEKHLYTALIGRIQNMLFTTQAELAGAQKQVTEADVLFEEQIVAEVEKDLPPITSFIVSGGGETGAYLDVCRTIARRAERGVIEAMETDKRVVSDETLKFLNRLSSVLYALARYANHQEGFTERAPEYS